ncbi:aerolysin-like protein [Erpetoichthys calabaricus]|uniref:Aerolysin-like protein n=1 Tax=Erpetoichthys calabaricus TaxID=27687 RepID=A0A8C4SJQ9_ERPCA|nr:aerolysin-like protein [Erpetoichthys calabaricus]
MWRSSVFSSLVCLCMYSSINTNRFLAQSKLALPVHVIGFKEGGKPFDFTGYETGAMLEKITVWVGESQINSIKIKLTNGETKQFGYRNYRSPVEFKFQPGELFTSLSLWANKDETRLGAIMFKTNKNREFLARMNRWEVNVEFRVDVGSGVCLGVIGRSGSDIDALGFMFLNSIKSIVMKNVEYTTLHKVIPCVTVEEIKSMTYRNKLTVEQEYTLDTSKTITRKSSWSVTNSLESSFSVSVQAGIPEVVEVNSQLSFKLGNIATYELETIEEKTEPLSYVIKVPPGKTMNINITIGRVNMYLPYKAIVIVTCTDGSTYHYIKNGTYNGITYTDAKAIIKESKKQLQ